MPRSDLGTSNALAVLDRLDSSTSDAEILAAIQRLDPKSKAELARRVESRVSSERQVWFCGNRQCDGKPHGAFAYRHARGDQYPPGGTSWIVWLLRGGRGSGKTRTGSEYTRWVSKKVKEMALIAPTGPAARSVMIEGESGLINACERAGEPCTYEPSKSRIIFKSGARAMVFSAEEPDRIRGNQFTYMWGDEPAHWENAADVWDQAMFALRLPGQVRPHALATTTPLPSDFIKSLIEDDDTVSRGVSTYANIDNLAEAVVRRILNKYEGTFLGRQEIHGEIIDDREGALWKSTGFEYVDEAAMNYDRVLVGIDPAGSQGKKSDITGIIVGGKAGTAVHALDDRSGKYSPAGWARAAIKAYNDWKADAIVVERNYGGDMCRETLRSNGYEGRIIEAQATDGKRLRAEPIAGLYEQHRAFHARGGRLAKLEREMVSWIPGESKSPNRLDAWVWVATQFTKGAGKAEMGNPAAGGTVGTETYKGPGSRAEKKKARGGASTWKKRLQQQSAPGGLSGPSRSRSLV